MRRAPSPAGLAAAARLAAFVRPAYPAGASTFLHAHRAFTRRPHGARVGLGAAALAVGLTAAWAAALPYVTLGWGHALAAVSALAGLPGRVVMTPYRVLGVLPVAVPHLDWAAGPPSAAVWTATALAAAVLLAVTLLLPERFTPLAYLLRAAVLVQAIALGYFALWPDAFPYTLGSYGAGMMATGLAVTSAVPLVLGATYFVHDVGVGRKVLLALLALGHSVVLVPLLYAAHAALAAAGSLLFLPPLYLLAGIPLHVMTLVALYAWGMSWPGPSAPLPS